MELPQRDRELVQIMDTALAEASRRAGEWLVCRPGCTQCCYGAFAINELDALRLAAGMHVLRRDQPLLANEVERRAAAWVAEHGAEFPGDAATGRLGSSDADLARFEDYANDAPCPALNPLTGLCEIYEWRPMTCRVFGPPVRTADAGGSEGLGHCELCFVGASGSEVAACEMPVPHDLEQDLVRQVESQVSPQGETLVAFALLRPR